MKDILFNIMDTSIKGFKKNTPFRYDTINNTIRLTYTNNENDMILKDEYNCIVSLNTVSILMFTKGALEKYIHINYTYNYEGRTYRFKFDSIKHNSESNIPTDEYIKKANEYISRHDYDIWISRQFVISMFRNK